MQSLLTLTYVSLPLGLSSDAWLLVNQEFCYAKVIMHNGQGVLVERFRINLRIVTKKSRTHASPRILSKLLG